MNIPVDYDDDKERDHTHPNLLLEEEDGVRYVPPTPERGEMDHSGPICTSNTGKDHWSVLSDKAIAGINKRGSALHKESKSRSKSGPERDILKRGQESKYSPRRKASPRSGHA